MGIRDRISIYPIRRLILCGLCVFTTWRLGKAGPVTIAVGLIAPAWVLMGNRVVSHGGVTTFDLDIALGLNRSKPCPGMPRRNPQCTELGGVVTVQMSVSARSGSIGRTLRVPLGMRKFDTRPTGLQKFATLPWTVKSNQAAFTGRLRNFCNRALCRLFVNGCFWVDKRLDERV